jgi:asparagine synthetase B (glutamine-hydrolysing)
MCGIAGYINWKGIGKETGVAEIVGGLRHRGPDDYGFWRSPDGLCELGHTRLSVIDLSSEGHQPMIDPLTKMQSFSMGRFIIFNCYVKNAKIKATISFQEVTQRSFWRFIEDTGQNVSNIYAVCSLLQYGMSQINSSFWLVIGLARNL